MQSSIKDLPAAIDAPHITIRLADWGDMTVEVGEIHQTGEAAHTTRLFKGLPDDRCQCPHWGYVIRGKLQLKFANHEEFYNAGDLYYAPPGHIPFAEAGCEYLDFSPTDQMHKTMEVLERNMKAMQSGARSG